MASADESKKALKFVQDRLKHLKLDSVPKEVLYNVKGPDVARDEGAGCETQRQNRPAA
jgi:hypothetical protein